MFKQPTPAELEALRKDYPVRTRIQLLAPLKEEKYSKLTKGDRGFVTGVDDMGHIQMRWDNEGSLALLPDLDEFVKVPYITDEMLACVKEIRDSGVINMFDTKAVFELALEKCYPLADLIFCYTPVYAHLILTGERELIKE
jgi:hypothetical protein